jgi:hypothetical protein
MLEIERSADADSRTAKGDVSKEILIKATKQHISDVAQACDFFADMLHIAASKHDWSKLEFMDEFHHDFVKSREEGTNFKFKSGTWWPKHMQERHHLNDRCPEDVTLIDVLERISDIVMAGMARSGIVYDDEISSDILQLAFKNTVELLKKNVKVVDNKDSIFNVPIDYNKDESN